MTASTWVFADRLETYDIMEGLRSGNFYASRGATISSVRVWESTLEVTTDQLSTIEFIGAGGVLQKTSRTFAAYYSVSGNEGYGRARVTRQADSAQAWSNPVYVEREQAAGPRPVDRRSGNLLGYTSASVGGLITGQKLQDLPVPPRNLLILLCYK